MRRQDQIVFLVNLLQDVNIIRPLVYLARKHFSVPIVILVSSKFAGRDKERIWDAELSEIRAENNASLHVYDSEWSAYRCLQGRTGLLIAATESNLSAHFETHKVFQVAPTSYLKITLQHGFEGVGFLQNREHNRAHGKNVTFAADVLCGWCDPSILISTSPSERPKLYISGPPALIGLPPRRMETTSAPDAAVGGLVCENLHSVRLRVGTDTKSSFLGAFTDFCSHLKSEGRVVTLRPHPGGQYVLKNSVALPDNVILNNKPIYKIDLTRFEYGISAPSSMVIDMVMAGIPVAVWQDGDSLMDADNYRGLVVISETRDWLAFLRDVRIRKDNILERQRLFLQSKKMPTDSQDVRNRFLRLFASGLGGGSAISIKPHEPQRVLFVANGFIPTLQLSFLKPLSDDVDNGRLHIDLITEVELLERFGKKSRSKDGEEWVSKQLEAFSPDLVVFVRYSGPHTKLIVDHARNRGATTIFHIDDDMLHVPREIGEKKYLSHNRPDRLEAVRNLLNGVDLVYCSTSNLLDRLRSLGFQTRMVAGEIYCSGAVIKPAVNRPVTKIGYMGFDHAADFALVLPSLVQVLRSQPHTSFELFGPIPKPSILDEFGDRISTVAPVSNYEQFLCRMGELNWDIGLCPLERSPFNSLKANTKWVEYTSAGAAVIATRGMAYDDCCSEDCGILATTEEEWTTALTDLCTRPDRRHRIVMNAQIKLVAAFSTERLRQQVYRVFQGALLSASSGRASTSREAA